MITCTNLNETDNAEDRTKFELLNGLAIISCRLRRRRTSTTRTRRRTRRRKKEYMMIIMVMKMMTKLKRDMKSLMVTMKKAVITVRSLCM
jgi:hypothetical protein